MKSSDAIALENIEDDCMDNAYWEIVSITGDFRLRLNGEIVGIGAKIYPTDLLEIEALSASTMSGSDQITFDIYEGSESGAEPLRTITRRFTAAAAEIMADYNGDGVRTSYDHWRKSLNSGGRWVVARCTEPYRLWIRNESPLDSDVVVTMSGETNRPSLKSGNRILLPGYSATNSAPFAMRNSSAVLLLDASGTNSTAVLSSSIQAPGGGVLDSEALTIEVVAVNLGERWIAAGETAHYSFGDWASNSYWEIMTASGG
ncbi:MAG: hypothetical protein GX804_03855, partial [Lentisphaerae bacterium]|nr:hypothetical protein [Lentisphaerota bacterium]